MLTSIVTVVPTPTVDCTSNLSTFLLMLGKPIPAPNPISLTSGDAVEFPSCIAHSMSGIPGPLSATLIIIELDVMSAVMTPP